VTLVVSVAEAEGAALSFAVAALGTVAVFHHAALRLGFDHTAAPMAAALTAATTPVSAAAPDSGPFFSRVIAELARHVLQRPQGGSDLPAAASAAYPAPGALASSALQELVSSCPEAAPEVVGALLLELQAAVDSEKAARVASDLDDGGPEGEGALCAAVAALAPVLAAAAASACDAPAIGAMSAHLSRAVAALADAGGGLLSPAVAALRSAADGLVENHARAAGDTTVGARDKKRPHSPHAAAAALL
jgi:hypothetical protein